MGNLLAAIIGILAAGTVGLINATIGPIVQWHLVDKSKDLREERKQKIKQWRTMIRDVWRHLRLMKEMKDEQREDNPDTEKIEEIKSQIDDRYEQIEIEMVVQVLQADERFYSLRNHLNPHVVDTIEDVSEDTPRAAKYLLPELLKTISHEIDRVENEWGL